MPSRDFRKGFVTAKPRDRAASVLSGTSGALYPIKLPSLPGATWSKVSGDANLSVSSAGVVSAISGLSGGASQTILVRGTVGNRAVEFQVTLSARSDAPVLSAANAVATSDTTASVGATTNVAAGTLYYVVSRGDQPSVEQIVAGLNAAGLTASANGSQAVSATGAKTFDAAGLSAATTYTAYFVQIDGAGQPSNVLASDLFTTQAAADTTAPVLSSPTATATGATSAALGVASDESNGTLYWYLSTSATPPSAANLEAGAGAVQAGSQDVSSTGPQAIGATGLAGSTTYYAHFLQVDAAGNVSAIVSSASFTTDAAGSAPSNSVAPSIAITGGSGSPTSGTTFAVSSNGTWTGAVSYARQWQRETGAGTGVYANIAGQTATAYITQAADVGLRIRCVVTATNSSGSTSANSNVLGPVTAGSGTALPASTLERTSGATTYPPTIRFDRPMEWQDGDVAVMQRSQDATFATGVIEVAQTMYAATTTYDFGLSGVTSGSWFFRMGAYRGTRPGLLWSNVINVGDVIPPVLSVTSTLKDDLGPLADVIHSNETGFFALSGADAALLELSTTDASANVTVRLAGNANLSAATKSAYDYTVTQIDYAGNVSSPLTRSLTITAADTTPDAFAFTDVSGATVSTQYTSNTITVAGLGAGVSVPVTITGGTYSKNGAAYTSADGTAQNGDTFAVRLTSSASGATSANASLTIGTVSDTYTVTTTGFTPLDLFLASESGDFYDATDYSTMWQDTAGTVPVTAAGQSVLRWVGKKHGRVLRPVGTNGPTTRVDGNGNRYLEFVGSSLQALSDATLVQTCDATTGEMTYAAAIRVADTTGNRFFVNWDDAASHRVAGLRSIGSGSQVSSYTSAGIGNDPAGTIVANTPFTLIGRRAGTSVEGFHDNVSNGVTTLGGTILKTTSPIVVGAAGPSGITYYTYDLYGGVVGIGRDLTATERGNLHTWLDNHS